VDRIAALRAADAASVAAPEPNTWTPVHEAVNENNMAFLRQLIAGSPEAFARDCRTSAPEGSKVPGSTPLHLLAFNATRANPTPRFAADEVVAASRGVLCYRNVRGKTAAHLAAASCNEEVIWALCQEASVSGPECLNVVAYDQNTKRVTALDLCLYSNSPRYAQLAQWLRNSGAGTFLRNVRGTTCLERGPPKLTRTKAMRTYVVHISAPG